MLSPTNATACTSWYFNMSKILITGASGFIGSCLVEEAIAKNHQVWAGIRSTSSRQFLEFPGLNFIDLDYSDPNSLEQKLKQFSVFDYVIHNMGLTKAMQSSDYFRCNTQYTKNLAEALIRSGRIPLKFIYMSSLAAFGPGGSESSGPIRLSDPPNPVTAYGKSKLESEKFLQGLKGFPWIIIRPTAVYGPREKDLLSVFRLINNRIEPLVGPENRILSFVFVKDLVRLVLKAMESEISYRSYFVSDGRKYGRNSFTEAIKAALEKKTFSVSVSDRMLKTISWMAEKISALKGQSSSISEDKLSELTALNWDCDVSAIATDFNFKAKQDLLSGVRETANWYKENNWLK